MDINVRGLLMQETFMNFQMHEDSEFKKERKKKTMMKRLGIALYITDLLVHDMEPLSELNFTRKYNFYNRSVPPMFGVQRGWHLEESLT